MGTMALDLKDADGEQLEILIPEAAKRPEILEIPHELIEPDPEQPRKNGDDELRASIAREGLLQDITVRENPEKIGHYLIVDGERRWRSAAGVLSILRCKLRQDLTASTTSRLAVQLIANTGKGLSPLEEAETFQRMLRENPEWTVSDLAKHVAKPRSTVAQRLESLELGAWLEDVASGALSWTMLVETLLPYRGCPDKVHAAARERVQRDGRWSAGEAPACGPRDFEGCVRNAYKPALYPLHKQKNSYGGGRDCEFNTKHHDAECSCGGMLVSDYSGSTPRKYCGNPSWWGPQHRKALKEKPKSATSTGSYAGESRSRAVKQELRLPRGSVEVTGSVHEAPPDGCAWVTTTGGSAWSIIADEPGFDPVVLQKLVKPADLVLVQGGDAVRVATTNLGAMKKARAAFDKRVQEAAAAALKPMRTVIKKHAPTTGISGAGVQALVRATLSLLGDPWESVRVIRALCAIEDIAPPADTDEINDRDDALDQWVDGLSAKDAKALLTGMAALAAAGFDIEGIPIVDDGGAGREAARRKVPWLKEVAAEKIEKTTPAKRPAKPSTKAPDPDDVDGAPACMHCGCTDLHSCAGGCYWVSTEPPVCSSPACRAAFAATGGVEAVDDEGDEDDDA